MSNPFYEHASGKPIDGARLRAEEMRAEFDAIANGFELVNAQGGGGGGGFAYLATTVAALRNAPADYLYDGSLAYMTLTGYEGFFKFSTANLSGAVALDPAMDIYVPPIGSTGDMGAWVRSTGYNELADLASTPLGRAILTATTQAALRVITGTQINVDVQGYDPDLAVIAALATTSFGRALLTFATAAELRTAADAVGRGGDTMTGPLTLPFVNVGQRAIVGGSIPFGTASIDSPLQILGKTVGTASANITRFEAGTNGATLILGHSRGANIGELNALLTGDTLGRVIFAGSNGAAVPTSAEIRVVATGAAPSTAKMVPSSMVFYISDAAGDLRPGLTLNYETGLALYGDVVINEKRHFLLKEYTRAQLLALSAAPGGQFVRVINDPSNRPFACSDGVNWRYGDGVIVT